MPIDYKKYPKNWKEIRERILLRANNECEFCGVENKRVIHRYGKGQDDWEYWPEGMESEVWSLENLKPTLIVLTIAHLDHDSTNHEVTDDRLAALCQKCHLGYDIDRHVANRKRNKIAKMGIKSLFE